MTAPVKRVLLVHNTYAQKGGEEMHLSILQDNLAQRGVDSCVYGFDSSRYPELSIGDKLSRVVQVPFSLSAAADIRRRMRSWRPDVIHVHNLFPFVTPSVLWACRAEGVPVVYTLHNFRTVCVNGLLMREQKPCELCIGGNTLHAVLGRCYRGQAAASALLAGTLALHRALGTWGHTVKQFIALSGFSREVLIRGGLPAHKMTVLPNGIPVAAFTPSPAPPRTPKLLFMGRLSQEKGISTLVSAFRGLEASHSSAELHVAGDGPLKERLQAETASWRAVHWHGYVSGENKARLLRESSFLVFPSECYENCPYVVLEALASGLPVLASRLGGTPELIEDGQSGGTFAPASADDLTRAMDDWLRSADRVGAMRGAARRRAADLYDIDTMMNRLLAIYERVSSSNG